MGGALWAARIPAGFTFNVKAFSLFTHHPTPVAALPKDLRPAAEKTHPRYVPWPATPGKPCAVQQLLPRLRPDQRPAARNLYVMTHSSQPGTTFALQASISSAFNAPSGRVNQPGTSQTLDPLDGLLPGGGVPTLNGGDTTLVNGFPTSSNFRFGDFSSVEVDPSAASSTCPKGRTAVLAQQYFDSTGHWVTRIARTSFC